MRTSKTQTTVGEAKRAFWLVSGKMKQDALHGPETSRQLTFTTVTCTVTSYEGIKADPEACGTGCATSSFVQGSSTALHKPKSQSWLLKESWELHKVSDTGIRQMFKILNISQ